MNLAALMIVLTLLWGAMTGSFHGANLLLGAFLALLILMVLRGRTAGVAGLRRVGAIAMLAGMFIQELMLSAVRVALIVLMPDLRSRLQPAIVAVPLTLKSDVEITLLANMITLTPGTLSIDVSDDHSVLYVHVLTLNDREALLAGIASGFEARIRAVFA
ncbi:Na+/H+ antiporter subunit E [uncultured Devosia sp.]|uniref:Na+/H+ antiporter subunit E n=1 Tax=uncultured Devosia sp. TaxID=211434 RepID=UPI0035CC6711